MVEKTIYLEGIEPIDIWGVNNIYFNTIKKLFPKLKLITRGNELKVIGETQQIEEFENKIAIIIKYVSNYNQLDENIINDIITSGQDGIQINEAEMDDIILFGNSGKPIKAKSVNQKKLVSQYYKYDLLFAIGPAGSGKTYTAIALAVRALKNREVRRIILCRPAVEAGERLGFLPGDMKDKLDPYLQPLYDALNDMIPPKKLAEFLNDGTVQIAPLAYMRGRTLSDAAVILDEAQNTTMYQSKMFLTRMGNNSKFIVTGDITQIDLPDKQNSGLIKGIEILKNIEGMNFIYFDKKDIVRHKLVRSIVDAYSNYLKNQKPDD